MDDANERHGLRRELRLVDLVLLQVLLIVGLSWVGSAAKEGSTHVALWLAGILLFYLPLAAAVILLSRTMPKEGGIYQWVKTGISPFAGYLAAWNNSFYTIVIFGAVGPSMVNSLAYIAGPSANWMMNSTAMILGTAVIFQLVAFTINVRGFHLGKWVTGSGSVFTIVVGVLMIYLLARRWLSGAPFAFPAFSLALPGISILTLNVFTKMAIGALSGFDNSSVFAEECYNPKRDLPRSVWLSAPSIAVVYILGTCAMLAYFTPDKVDLAAPAPQLMQAGFGNSGLGEVITLGTVGAMTLSTLSGAVGLIASASRFPMVIGWDGLLPAWWSELHPRFRTPVKALAAVTAACLLVAVVSSWGAGGQEIIQVGMGAAVACLCIMYALLFAVILFAKRSLPFRPSIAYRLAALSGFVVSLAALPFQVFPLTGVSDPGIFAVKVSGLVIAINALGVWLYWRGSRRVLEPR